MADEDDCCNDIENIAFSNNDVSIDISACWLPVCHDSLDKIDASEVDDRL